MEYYLGIKRNELLIHVTTWINFENIMLNERSQSQKATYYMLPFIQNVQNRQIYRDRKWISGCLGLEMGEKLGGNGSDC